MILGHSSKGHSTKGHHKVHKLDEFNKKKKFFDVDHDEAFKESHGGYEITKAFNLKDNNESGDLKNAYIKTKFGVYREAEKGADSLEKIGFDKKFGNDGFFKNNKLFLKKFEIGDFKTFGYTHH